MAVNSRKYAQMYKVWKNKMKPTPTMIDIFLEVFRNDLITDKQVAKVQLWKEVEEAYNQYKQEELMMNYKELWEDQIEFMEGVLETLKTQKDYNGLDEVEYRQKKLVLDVLLARAKDIESNGTGRNKND